VGRIKVVVKQFGIPIKATLKFSPPLAELLLKNTLVFMDIVLRHFFNYFF
jgi:hypothetical protein